MSIDINKIKEAKAQNGDVIREYEEQYLTAIAELDNMMRRIEEEDIFDEAIENGLIESDPMWLRVGLRHNSEDIKVTLYISDISNRNGQFIHTLLPKVDAGYYDQFASKYNEFLEKVVEYLRSQKLKVSPKWQAYTGDDYAGIFGRQAEALCSDMLISLPEE